MSRPHAERHPFKRALGYSLALHALLFSLFAAPAVLSIGSATLDDGARQAETTAVHYLTIERRVRPVPQRAVLRTPVRMVRVVSQSPAHPAPPLAASTRHTVRHVALAATSPVVERSVAFASLTAQPQPARHARAPQEVVASPAPQPSASGPPPVPSAPPTNTPDQVASRGIDVAPGGWGQSFERPLIADDDAVATLRAHYHAAAPITIDVDEAGHATRVTLPSDVPAELRAELEKQLLELRYVPAECNGLRCGGTLQLEI